MSQRSPSAEYDESVDEMRHADHLIERILFLEGRPNLNDLDNLMVGDSVHAILENDLKLENLAIPVLRDAIAHCEQSSDYISRDLLPPNPRQRKKSMSTGWKPRSSSSSVSASRITRNCRSAAPEA